MTKGEIVAAAYIKLTGGYPNMDSTTWWEDVDLLFAPAVNYVMNGDYFLNRRDEGEDKIIQPLFLQTFKNISVNESSEGKLQFKLPKSPLALPKVRSLEYVGDMAGNEFIQIENGGRSMQKYLQKFKKCETSYEITGLDVELENAVPLLKKVMVRMIVSAKSVLENEEVLLPDGGELKVMDLMIEFFLGQKQLPKDYYNTGKEPQIG